MPRKNTSSDGTNVPSTVAELREKFAEYQSKIEKFESINIAMKLLDLTKTETRTFQVFSKERLRTYMKNPMSNAASLRNLSRFLYRVSQSYRRQIQHNSQMIDLTAQTLIPIRSSFVKDDKAKTVLDSYYETAVQVDKMKLYDEIYKCLIIAWREDCFYGYTYEDETGFFIWPLDGDYCKPSSINYDGTLNFAFDFSYFRSHSAYLDFWDAEFSKKYNAYINDATLRWQELDPERTICLKVNIDDMTLVIPPYVGMFEQIIDNVDLQAIQAIKDELSIYKLLVARLKTLSNTKDPDDFEVDPDTAVAYYNKFRDKLPDGVDSTISPLPIDVIEFKGNTTEDVDMIANSVSNLFKVSGGSLILDNVRTGTTIYEAQILSDTLNGLIPLLPQIEKWINRYIGYRLKNPAKVHYIHCSPWTKSKTKKELLESGQYGIPDKMAIASLDGFSPLESLSIMYLENDILQLHNKWVPLQSSYTRSWRDNGRMEKDSDELTDEGSETREQDKNGKG